MSDSRRCSNADSENMREKIYKNLFAGRAQGQKCSETLAPIQCQAVLIYHFELQILPKVSKSIGILVKTLKNGFAVKNLPREVNLPILEKSTGLKLQLVLVSRNIFDAAPCRE